MSELVRVRRQVDRVRHDRCEPTIVLDPWHGVVKNPWNIPWERDFLTGAITVGPVDHGFFVAFATPQSPYSVSAGVTAHFERGGFEREMFMLTRIDREPPPQADNPLVVDA